MKNNRRQGSPRFPTPRVESFPADLLPAIKGFGIMYISWRVGYKIVASNSTSVGVYRRNRFFLCIVYVYQKLNYYYCYYWYYCVHCCARDVLKSVMNVECLWVSFGLVGGNILDLGGSFVAVVVEMEVDDFELEV